MEPTLTHLEADRMEALHRLRLLDSPREPEFDELAELAASLCGAPIAAITLVDSDRQWFKAARGLDFRETPRDIAFAWHTVQQQGLFLIEDAATDDRFAANPLVLREPGIRFYAGIALFSPEGHAVGSLCVMDTTPRRLSAPQLSALAVLGRQASARMELRVRRLEQNRILRDHERLSKELQAAEDRFRLFMDQSPFLSFVKSMDGRLLYYNRRFAERFGISLSAWIGKTDFDLFPPEDALAYRENDLAVLRGGRLQVIEERSRETDGSASMWQVYKFPCASADGLTMLGGIALDVTEASLREQKLTRMRAELTSLREQVELMNALALRERAEALELVRS